MDNQVTDSNYEQVVFKSEKPVVIDFWAEWCGPCKMITPIIEQLAEEYKDKAFIAKVDVDNNPEITTKLGIRNIPTILFFKGGKVVDKQVGAVSRNVIVSKLEALFK